MDQIKIIYFLKGGSAIFILNSAKESYLSFGGLFEKNVARRGTIIVLNIRGHVEIPAIMRQNLGMVHLKKNWMQNVLGDHLQKNSNLEIFKQLTKISFETVLKKY